VVAGGLLFFDGGECTEQKAIDVGQYGGTAWGDAALLEGEGKIPQESVDVGGGFFFGKVGEERAERSAESSRWRSRARRA
jgi:hypothetical protein